MPKYEDIDGDYEYLDLSKTNMSYTQLLEVITDLSGDTMLKQVDLSTLITLEDASQPSVMEEIMLGLQCALETNVTLTALDFEGNHLGDFGPCNGSAHRLDYLKELTSSLVKSTITRLDISRNNIIGSQTRVYSSFADLLRLYCAQQCQVLRCRHNSLHNQAFSLTSHILGPFSILIELDLSDNCIGLDPFGNNNSEMTRQICLVLSQTQSLVKLYLARNHLTSEDIVYISEAIQKLPGLNLLDIGGNKLTETGMSALADAVQGHANLKGKFGLKTLIMGSNPIGCNGLEILSPALRLNDTITLLDISHCGYRTKSLESLRQALQHNSTLLKMDTSRNKITQDGQEMVQAEVEASNCLLKLTCDVHSINAFELSTAIRSALQRKLHFLPQGVLQLLHSNESFNEPFSEMMDELHMLCPPNRHHLIHKVQENSETIKLRLAFSGFAEKKITAQRVIYNAVRKWWKRVQFEKRLAASYGVSRKRSVVGRKLSTEKKEEKKSGGGGGKVSKKSHK